MQKKQSRPRTACFLTDLYGGTNLVRAVRRWRTAMAAWVVQPAGFQSGETQSPAVRHKCTISEHSGTSVRYNAAVGHAASYYWFTLVGSYCPVPQIRQEISWVEIARPYYLEKVTQSDGQIVRSGSRSQS